MLIAGGCLCAKVRYECSTKPITARLCWCRFCQHIAAGNAALSAGFLTASVTVSGETRDFMSTAASGNTMHRRFCPQCGVHLFSEAQERPHLIFVRAGTLDDPTIVKPAATIWTSQAPPWAFVDPSLPSFEGQPPPIA
ncbi:MAG: GFA family protein [Hyphomicrobiales bacterium]|nr:GFA family protein [Hyphomicrobiales bacterium]